MMVVIVRERGSGAELQVGFDYYMAAAYNVLICHRSSKKRISQARVVSE